MRSNYDTIWVKLSAVFTGDNPAMRPCNDNYIGTEIQGGIYILERDKRLSYEFTTPKTKKL